MIEFLPWLGVSRWPVQVPLAVLHSIPKPSTRSDGAPAQDADQLRRQSAIASIHHRLLLVESDRRFLVHGGLRESSRHPLELIVGGVGAVLPRPSSSAWVTMHAGSQAGVADAVKLRESLLAFKAWCRLDVRLHDVASQSDPDLARLAFPTLNDGLLSAWEGPLAWILVARPMAEGRVSDFIEKEIQRTWEKARDQGTERFISARLGKERLESLAKYIRQSIPSGLWEIELHAGADSVEAAAQVAALLASSIDRADLPYVIEAMPPTAMTVTEGAERWVGAVSSEMLGRLCALPVSEVPGVRLVQRSTFDVTPERISEDAEGALADGVAPATITLAQILDAEGRPAGDFRVPLSTLNRHSFICGATGSGKSQTTRHLLAQLAEAGVPWLVIEPAKAEYRRLTERLPLVVIRPGDLDAIPVGINPLEPEPGFPLQTHLDLVRALFLAAFEADEPFPQVLAASLTRCYEELGWDLVQGRQRPSQASPSYPYLANLQAMARRVVEEIGYGPEVRQNVTGFMEVRLSSLRLGTTGRFFEGGHALDIGSLLKQNCVVEIEDVGDDQDKAFMIGTFLIRLAEHLRVRDRRERSWDLNQPSRRLQHVTVIEEAHRLLRKHEQRGPAAMAVEIFASLLAEVRAYREGIIVAEQIPNKIVPDVIKNSALKVIHRLPARDDRDLVGATVNLSTAQSEFVVSLSPGEAAVARDGMDNPILVRVPDNERGPVSRSRPKSALQLVGRFACDQACDDQACTLDHMREAERVVAEEPCLMLWAELAVIAHLTGWTVPHLGPRMLITLYALDDHRRSCAIGQGVRSAVNGRAAAILPSMTPASLASHVTAELREQLAGGAEPARLEAEWLAREYRWPPLWRALNDWVQLGRGAERHPESDGWEATLGAEILGSTGIEQRAWVAGRERLVRREPGVARAILLGVSSPTAIERAVGASVSSDDWQKRLSAAMVGLELRPDWSPYVQEQVRGSAGHAR